MYLCTSQESRLSQYDQPGKIQKAFDSMLFIPVIPDNLGTYRTVPGEDQLEVRELELVDKAGGMAGRLALGQRLQHRDAELALPTRLLTPLLT